jgi:hypothetical protein
MHVGHEYDTGYCVTSQALQGCREGRRVGLSKAGFKARRQSETANETRRSDGRKAHNDKDGRSNGSPVQRSCVCRRFGNRPIGSVDNWRTTWVSNVLQKQSLNVGLGSAAVRAWTPASRQGHGTGRIQSAASARDCTACFPVGLYLFRRPHIGFGNTPALFSAGYLPFVSLG